MNERRIATIALTASLILGLVTAARANDEDGAARQTSAQLPEGAVIEKVEVWPESIELAEKYAYRQLLVTGTLAGGGRVDLTRLAKYAVEPAGAATADASGRVSAVADGETRLVVRFGEAEHGVPVSVSGQGERFRASYVQDVQPILSRLGCNQGTCHGSAKGKNGFKLSLRGNDYLFDHRALTDDLAGRRFNRADPDRSLFLLKASGAVPHVGGVLTEPGHAYYDVLRSWVADGVKLDLSSPRVEKIELHPKNRVLPLPGMRQQMAVLATFSDGVVRDVTHEAFVETNDIEITEVSRGGVVTGLRRGECAILARYEGRYDATQLFVMGDRSGWEWEETPEYNWIDGLVHQKLRKVKSLSSDVCTDAEFIRRIYLDLTGLTPRAREVSTFLADRRSSRTKREELVDRLIGSAEFVEYWTNKWSDLLQVNPKWLGDQGADALRDWIHTQVASNTPYDQFVHAVLTGSGSTLANPPAAYYKVLRTPEEVMENTTQLFLGIRFNCNKCHDHPFERWTENNYWELAAFFAQVDRKDAPGSRKMPRRSATQTEIPAFEEIISDASEGEIAYPTGGDVDPSFPYVFTAEQAAGAAAEAERSRRASLASWITSSENPYFAKSYVNRLWSYFLGVGLIDPVDDIRAGNPPTNPELLDRLTSEFIASGFDTRHMIRLILKSRTYGLSIRTSRWNEDDGINFSHALARRLPAEVLFDAIHRSTGSTAELPGLRRGARAVEAGPAVKLGDGFLDLFGRPPRESACECERSNGMSLGQALNLINGPTLAEAIRDPENAISDIVRVERDDRDVIEELYLSILSRQPTGTETAELLTAFDTTQLENADALEPARRAELTKRQAAWESSQNLAVWRTITPELLRSEGGATLEPLEDGSVLVTGENPDSDTYTLVAYTDAVGITGLRLEVLPHDSLPAKGPGRAENGNFVLAEMRVGASSVADPSQAVGVSLQNATQSYTQNGFAAAQVIDGKNDDRKGWAIADQFGRAHEAVFETKEDVGFEGGTLLTFRLEQPFGGKHTIGRLRLSVATTPRPVRLTSLPENVIAALLVPEAERTTEQRGAIFRAYIATDEEMRREMRLGAAQDIAWALLNSPAFLFNR